MAFLATFAGMLLASVAWTTLFLVFYDAHDPRVRTLDEFISPNAVTGWIFFVALCLLFCWLLYRVLGVRLRHHD